MDNLREIARRFRESELAVEAAEARFKAQQPGSDAYKEAEQAYNEADGRNEHYLLALLEYTRTGDDNADLEEWLRQFDLRQYGPDKEPPPPK